jgi:methylmalonyl-CoA/ethylmalonyl-CoA epimerase
VVWSALKANEERTTNQMNHLQDIDQVAPTESLTTANGHGASIGNIAHIAIVTPDLYRSIDNLAALGIGPFAIFTMTPNEVQDQRYRDEPGDYSMLLGFAQVGNMEWEVVQPISGQSLYQDFLDEGRTGIHHVGADLNGISYKEKIAYLKGNGYRELQAGVAFGGTVPFGYYHNGELDVPIVEIFQYPEGFSPPDPDEWYPHPPE